MGDNASVRGPTELGTLGVKIRTWNDEDVTEAAISIARLRVFHFASVIRCFEWTFVIV